MDGHMTKNNSGMLNTLDSCVLVYKTLTSSYFWVGILGGGTQTSKEPVTFSSSRFTRCKGNCGGSKSHVKKGIYNYTTCQYPAFRNLLKP